MFFGYNTNGWSCHALEDAVRLLAEIGYRGVAVSIDHHALPPGADDLDARLDRLRRLLDDARLRSAVETDARYLLDPRRKHEPTLISPQREGRRRRLDFYRHAIRCAAALGSDCVSIWSGRLWEGVSPEEARAWLLEGLEEVLDLAAERAVRVALEPEPGMWIDTLQRFDELVDSLRRDDLGLTLDVGHVHCQGEGPLDEAIRWRAGRLVHVHIEDMRRGAHEHLMFGQGEIDFPPVFQALAACGYAGGAYVELSRHGHVAPEAAREALAFLRSVAGGA